MNLIFSLVLILNVNLLGAYKVLVYNPAFAASHSNFLGKISDILIDAGHEVTMFIPIFEEKKRDLVGSKKVQKVIHLEQDSRLAQIQKSHAGEEILRKRVWKMSSDMTSMFSFLNAFMEGSAVMCENIFKDEELLKRLEDEKFDLAISEACFICGFVLFDRIGVRSVINADSMLFMGIVKTALGEPASAAYYPDVFSSNSDKMSFIQRLQNLFVGQFMSIVPEYKSQHEINSIKYLYNTTKTPADYLSGIAFNFVNSNRYLDYASPTLPKTVFIGGMQVNTNRKNKRKLEKHWDDLLNLRKTTILVSFGSMAFSSDMPDEYKNAFLEVFESMPDTTFIWKYEIENATLADHLENVHLTTWMPQVDLLADDRLDVFITHGGLGSTVEIAYQGKPAIVIPLISDQPRNGRMLTRHEGALQLDKTDLENPEKIKKAIETVLNNPEYKENAKKLARILAEQPYNPKDVVLKHCDFAVKFGPLDTLNSEGRHLNTFQFYSFDIALAGFVVLLVLLSILYLILRLTLRLVRKLFSNPKKKVE